MSKQFQTPIEKYNTVRTVPNSNRKIQYCQNYLCVRGIDFVSYYDFSIGVWNCSDSIVFFF
jgi:hypothetical protein